MLSNDKKTSPLGLYSIGIAALFLIGFFLLIVFGAQNYRGAVTAQHANDDSRVLLSYVSTCLSSCDETDCVQIRKEFLRVSVGNGSLAAGRHGLERRRKAGRRGDPRGPGVRA